MADSVTFIPGYEMQSGTGVPAPDLGMDTDRYVDYATGDFYVKANGTWTKMATFGPSAVTGRLVPVATQTIGETTVLSLALGVKRYNVLAPGTVTTDRIVVALTGAPTNGTLQDAYVTSAGTVSIGVLAPALGIGATIAVPIAVYKVS
jgi:hypothetical protein